MHYLADPRLQFARGADSTQACSTLVVPTQEFAMSDKKSPLSRRQMVAGAGTVGALAAAASVLPLGQPQDVPAAAEATRAADTTKPGYRLTAHIERYYQTTKV